MKRSRIFKLGPKWWSEDNGLTWQRRKPKQRTPMPGAMQVVELDPMKGTLTVRPIR